MLVARHDDDDDDLLLIICTKLNGFINCYLLFARKLFQVLLSNANSICLHIVKWFPVE